MLKSEYRLSKLISIIYDTTVSVVGGTLLSQAFLHRTKELASLSSYCAKPHLGSTFRLIYSTCSGNWTLKCETEVCLQGWSVSTKAYWVGLISK